jgi:RNA polymerase sigma-70 factor (ECF subfamily)
MTYRVPIGTTRFLRRTPIWLSAPSKTPSPSPLYQRYVTPVYRYCYRQTSDPDVAADLTAQIFTRALEALPRFKVKVRPVTADGATTTFRAWLFAIAHNAIVDRHRRERPSVPLDPVYDQLADSDDGPEARAIHQDELERLIAALASLPESHRQIIELRIAGLTTTEIGETLGISRAAVKSAQTRAYSRLREILEPSTPPRHGATGTHLQSQSEPATPTATAEEPSR